MRRFVVVLLAAALVGACSGEDALTTSTTNVPLTTTSTAGPTTTVITVPPLTGTPVVMDTDLAAEGFMSILYMLGRTDIDLRAITVSGTGLVHCGPGVEQALGLVALAGRAGVQVACGPEEPLEGRNAFPTSWRAGADEAYGVTLPAGGEPSGLSAPDLLAGVILAVPEPVIVYTDGPLTNLALAVQSDPAIVQNIAMVYSMAGAVDVPGTTIKNPDAEWNVWVDPAAMRVVLESGVPLTLVPLDATNQVPLNRFHLRAFEQYPSSRAAALVAGMLQNNEQVFSGGLYFWDQLTAVIATDEAVAGYEDMSLSVTVADDSSLAGTLQRDPAGVAVRVATTVDRPGFESEFLSGLVGEPVGPVEETPDLTVSFDGETWDFAGFESLTTGSYVLGFGNSGDLDACAVVGWLTGEATRADLEAWGSLDQPPFFELAGAACSQGGAPALFVQVELADALDYYLLGLDVSLGVPEVLAGFDAVSP